MADPENNPGKAEYYLQRGLRVPDALVMTSADAKLQAENSPYVINNAGIAPPDQDHDGIPDNQDPDADGDGRDDQDEAKAQEQEDYNILSASEAITEQFANLDVNDEHCFGHLRKEQRDGLKAREEKIQLDRENGASPLQIERDRLKLAGFKATIMQEQAEKTGDAALLARAEKAQERLAERGQVLDRIAEKPPAEQAALLKDISRDRNPRSTEASSGASLKDTGLSPVFGQSAPMPQSISPAPVPQVAVAASVPVNLLPPAPIRSFTLGQQ